MAPRPAPPPSPAPAPGAKGRLTLQSEAAPKQPPVPRAPPVAESTTQCAGAPWAADDAIPPVKGKQPERGWSFVFRVYSGRMSTSEVDFVESFASSSDDEQAPDSSGEETVPFQDRPQGALIQKQCLLAKGRQFAKAATRVAGRHAFKGITSRARKRLNAL